MSTLVERAFTFNSVRSFEFCEEQNTSGLKVCQKDRPTSCMPKVWQRHKTWGIA